MSETTWGLDVSTSPTKTAAVALQWTPSGARIVEVRHPRKSTDIADLIAEQRGQRWAVDVPFGCPDRFVALIADRHDGPLPAESIPAAADWETWRTKLVAQRRTDAFLTVDPRIVTRPLPASFQLLGATAAMWVLVEARLVSLGVRIDRSGIDGTVCETDPTAALRAWGAPTKAKHDWRMLQDRFPFLSTDPEWLCKLAIDDVCDAVVCAMVARARDLGLTIEPRNSDERAAGRREGWIHVSVEPAARLLEPAA